MRSVPAQRSYTGLGAAAHGVVGEAGFWARQRRGWQCKSCPALLRPSARVPAPLPQRGDEFTEDQLLERFGAPRGGSVRASATSPDIILVRNAHGVVCKKS